MHSFFDTVNQIEDIGFENNAGCSALLQIQTDFSMCILRANSRCIRFDTSGWTSHPSVFSPKMAIVLDIINYFFENPGLLITGILLYIFIFVLSLFFTKPAPAKNPFKYDAKKEPKPLVTDQKVRDSVLKQGM